MAEIQSASHVGERPARRYGHIYPCLLGLRRDGSALEDLYGVFQPGSHRHAHGICRAQRRLRRAEPADGAGPFHFALRCQYGDGRRPARANAPSSGPAPHLDALLRRHAHAAHQRLDDRPGVLRCRGHVLRCRPGVGAGDERHGHCICLEPPHGDSRPAVRPDPGVEYLGPAHLLHGRGPLAA